MTIIPPINKRRADNCEIHKLSALRLSVWLVDNGYIHLSYCYYGFSFAFRAKHGKVFEYRIFPNFCFGSVVTDRA